MVITVYDVNAEDLVAESINYIVFQIDTTIHNNLTLKLKAVADSLEIANAVAAINKLHAFENSVEAQRGKKLSQEQVDKLISTLQRSNMSLA
ncbi:hypothetical protein [Paenibacillus sp. LjRoot56]|uniref:hypothetical protein n=1 Tax=Paenibacillus sp. LjRoot56 TaxID=3342333 RepID=UPI003ECDB248